MSFVKSQTPSSYCVRISFRMLEICLATIGVCAFGAVTSVAAFFIIFTRRKIMGLVSGKCPECGANLKINENAKGELTCPYCGGTYLVENAINIVNNEIINHNNFSGANVVINQNAKDAYVKQYLENARRALSKEDWEEVEKYYNMVEQYEPHNIEAVFFSSYGKAMLSLSSTEYAMRQQKFKVLEKSISVINDYYELTNENKEEVLKTISVYIKKIVDADFVYNNSNGVFAIGGSSWCKSLLKPIPNDFLIELKQIAEIHDDLFIQDLIKENEQTKSSGCYVATCVYGSYDCPEVWTLRRYRDNTLASTWYGRAFIHTYYAISPTLVKWFGKTKWFKKMWKGKLDRMVAKLQAEGVENTPYNDKPW